MAAPTPSFVPLAFAANAAGPYRNTIPLNTATPGRASFDLGFPPITMTPVISGGRPPLGQDVNGILYMLSSHTVYQQTGQPYRWSADVAAAVGGYAVGTLLGSTDGSTLWYNLTVNNTSNPDAAGAGWVAMWSYGITPVSGLTGGVRTLTPAEAAKSVLVLTGTLVANLQLVVPSQVRRWLIINSTTGLFSVTVKTSGGTGVVVPNGGFTGPVEVWSDGTNVYNVVAPVNLPIDQAPNPLTIVQRTNSGYVYATYFNQNSSLENFAVSAVFAETANDGFHRKITPANLAAQIALSQFAGQVTNAQVPQSAVTQHSAAVLSNAALTGVPTAPTAAPGTNTSQVATTAFVNGVSSIGVGQSWTNPGKDKNITYVNSTGRPILVNVSINITSSGGNANANVGGVTVCNTGNGSSADNEVCLSFIVPAGLSYRVNGSGSRTNVSVWAELV